MTRASPRREVLLLGVLTLAPLLPFLDAAVSLDAPVFLAVSRQILASPADPYGFDMIWDPSSPHAAEFDLNPPLLSYYLAPWIAAFGERAPVLHAALLPFPLLAALAFLGVARRSVGAGLAPAALLVTAPAFMVLATTFLLDVPALAFLLLAVYALLRGSEVEAVGWPALAGLCAAAAGLTKYAAMAAAPLLGAGVLLLYARRGRAALLALGIPLAVWSLWGAWTAQRYGAPHFLGGAALVGGRAFTAAEFWNQTLSLPIYYGAALVFPLLALVRALLQRGPGLELALGGIAAGLAVVLWVLPEGYPPRRGAIGTDEAALAVASFAAALFVWGLCLRPRRWLASRHDAFLALWLAGFGAFSLLVNWHVNAADALLAAPPALLLLYRTPELRPSPRAAALWSGVALCLSLALAFAEMEQAGVYRSAARQIAAEIGAAPGARWFVGHWGFQYYLEREGFRAVPPRDYGPAYPHPEPAAGDWIATARNLSQLDVSHWTSRVAGEEVLRLEPQSALPLRTTHPDSGAGLYSHHVGYLPFAFDTGPLERISLGRITRVARATATPR